MPQETRDRVNLLLQELGKASGLSGAMLDARGRFSLSLDGEVWTAMHREETEDLYLFHTLGPLPEEREERARISAFLLERNCFFRGVGKGVLGVFAGQIHYTMVLDPRSLAYPDFERLLLFAVDLCAGLKREMNERSSPEAAAEAEGDAAGYVRV
ncbi:MAG: type III secretion system chaperone [Desulfovibrio sp.]|jgi:hypothetical protein|nr:type III secretion system chaperone [Desulfovibrio sp.]